MARVLLLLVVAFLIWLALRLVRGNGGAARVGDVNDATTTSRSDPETIEQCAWCGVHAPTGTALALPDGRIYCSEAHREQARLAAAPSTRPGP